MKLIGLTGTIASGKSTVATILNSQPNTRIINTDMIARDAVEVGSDTLKTILNVFGSEYAMEDGSLDRKRLGALIFNNKKAKHILENVTHPKIMSLLAERIAALENFDFIVIENAILFESRQHHMMDAFIIIDVASDIQKRRLMARNSLNSDEADRRINAQMSTNQKIEEAQKLDKPFVVIENNFDNFVDLEYSTLLIWQSFISVISQDQS